MPLLPWTMLPWPQWSNPEDKACKLMQPFMLLFSVHRGISHTLWIVVETHFCCVYNYIYFVYVYFIQVLQCTLRNALCETPVRFQEYDSGFHNFNNSVPHNPFVLTFDNRSLSQKRQKKREKKSWISGNMI